MPTIEQARAWYSDHDPVHGFDHVLRVYHIADKLAVEENADREIVRAAALLHDVQIASIQQDRLEEQKRSDHHLLSADFAVGILRAELWPEERIEAVCHCVRAHRFRDNAISPQTLEAKILYDADKLDAIGAIGVARAIAFAVQAGQPFFVQPSTGFLRDGQLEPCEPHSAYHEYLFKLVKIKDGLHTRSAQEMARQRQQRMVAFFTGLSSEMTEIETLT